MSNLILLIFYKVYVCNIPVSLYKHCISELKEEAADRAMKAADTAAQRASEMTQSWTDRQQRAEVLAEKLRSLSETHHKLSHHMSHYRRRLLNGNPTAYSKKFAEALNELKKYGTFKNGSGQ